ncbi:enoyl-CoA hydratase/isomerase family protein [Pseudomonas matsuisoli]|uniref:3-hydroxyisobutyryl-CoA hydrolase n=1 Tax=Pseudomonas matsuisoli TaxID=1515666 RepID=A0A917Q329_9PSED|nr:enoyl-CoA hydratase/isomerase family protein [Pseudomonas matsuisoli]GGK08895.1 crotonase [Pseudomonas matsuisoli]
MSDATVLVDVRNQVGHLVLNRPNGLNALSLEMIRVIEERLREWETDDGVQVVVLRANGEKAFCAGGDIRALYDSYAAGDELHRIYFDEEFALDRHLHDYPKPIVALMDGYVLGGGMGLAQGASIRVISERVRMAMPETAIGYFPDVGASHFLARLPHNVGLYMGLTGNQINAADALALGLADWHLPRERFGAFLDALDVLPWQQSAIAELDALLNEYAAKSLPDAELEGFYSTIERHFTYEGVNAILASLQRESDPHYQAWAQATRNTLESRSPLAVNVAFEALKRGQTLNQHQAFDLELHLVKQWLDRGDLLEGVRALIVDKDKEPRWKPARFEEVDQAKVAAFFDGFSAA